MVPNVAAITAANDRQDKFVAASKTPPPPSCP
jgi:hypothetical protein